MSQRPSLKILVVDDEEIVRYTLGELFQLIGHEADLHTDSLSGLRALRHASFDMAFFDIRMPGMGGIHLLRQALEIQPDLPVIIMTGHGDAETRKEALDAGAFSFLYKPFRIQDVNDILSRVCPAGKTG